MLIGRYSTFKPNANRPRQVIKSVKIENYEYSGKNREIWKPFKKYGKVENDTVTA